MSDIYEIKHKKCKVYPGTDHITKEGRRATVVGAYQSEYWYPKLYRAYHVIYENGEKDTVKCSRVKILGDAE